MCNLIPKSPLILLSFLYIFRLLNAFCVTNILFPDEWWQFSEPAHVAIYGYGYMTWDWRAGIRSYVPILPLMLLMQVTKILGGESWIAKNGSKVVMAGWMALTDFYTYKLAGKLFGPLISPYALLFSLTSSFHASRSIRSLSNNIEMALITVALFYAPVNKKSGNFRVMLAVIGLSCLVRVTTIIFWLTPGLITLRFVNRNDRLISTSLIILVTIIFGLFVDSYFYGKLTFSWWIFYKWNVLKKVSEFYGRESVFYHFKVTLPLMLNSSLGYFGYGMWRGGWRKDFIGLTMLMFLVLSSMQTHKETRFLAPIYPLLLILISFGAQQVTLLVSKKNCLFKVFSKMFLLLVIFSNVLIGWFYSRVHYNGAYEILDKLNGLTRDYEDASVYFLTPCHVLPFKGYLHREEFKMDFLKCHPRVVDELMPEEESNARDHFNRDTISFVNDNVISEGYSHLILYESDLEKYANLLKGKYSECARAKSSKIIKRRGDLLIYCKKIKS